MIFQTKKLILGTIVILSIFLTSCKLNNANKDFEGQERSWNWFGLKEGKHGYKEFTWGQSVEEVKVKAKSKLVERGGSYADFEIPIKAMLFFHAQEFSNGRVGNPMRLEDGKITAYDSYESDSSESEESNNESGHLTFWFRNGKLLAVTVDFRWDTDILPSLIDNYGKSKPMGIVMGILYPRNYDVVAWDQKTRIIVWSGDTFDRHHQEVTYMDGDWFHALRDKTLSQRRKQESSQKSRID